MPEFTCLFIACGLVKMSGKKQNKKVRIKNILNNFCECEV